jgi:ribosomal-protein-alanine N-acetyltransferase
MASRCRIRAFDPADLDAIHRIEREVFSDPWSRHALASAATGIALVAEGEGHVAGYLFARRAADEMEILNVAVRPSDRRRGIGEALVREACRIGVEEDARAAFLEVRESNADAVALYRQLGFREVGRRQAYYRRPVEDALVLARELD